MKTYRSAAIVAFIAAACSGCSSIQQLTDAPKIAAAIGHVEPSSRDTCETQRQLAAQSSRIDTIIRGKETVYKPAPCKSEPGPASTNPTS